MKNIKHYLTLFADAETIGANLLARALAAAGDDREPRFIARELDESSPSERAISLVAGVALTAAAEMDEPGALLRQVRDGLGWSRKEMGERLGLPVQGHHCRTLESWENATRTPEWEGRKAIKGLGVELKGGL